MESYVREYVLSCDLCGRAKAPRHKPYGLLKSHPIPELPWQVVSLDFITDLPKSGGWDTILVTTCDKTRMAHFIPTIKEIDA